MALLDCAINKKCCTVDGGRGICPLFSSPPRGICQLKSPHPRKFAIQGQKNADSRGLNAYNTWRLIIFMSEFRTGYVLPIAGAGNKIRMSQM